MEGKFIAYYRVSTTKQGTSGLGIEAQQQAVANYLDGGKWKLIAEFIETESGKKSDRPMLAEALKLCRKHKATLLIAKLDRLARNVHFISGLMEARVKFVALDVPDSEPFILHIKASVAQEEARMISERTKAALQAAKDRGKKLGGLRNPLEQQKKILKDARAARTSQRIAWERRLRPEIDEIRVSGAKTLREIANELNRRGEETARGRQWTATQVHRLLKHTEAA